MPSRNRDDKPGKPRLTDDNVEPHRANIQQWFSGEGKSTIWDGFACKLFQYESAPAPTCPSSCGMCRDQFVPVMSRAYPKKDELFMHDDATAASEIKNLISTTQDGYAHIRAKIDTFGNAIAKRWQKKNATGREQLILTAMPNMFMHRSTELEHVFEDRDYFADVVHLPLTKTNDIPAPPSSRRIEDPFLTPFLNVQALSESKTQLLALMHYRASVHQSEWTTFDHEMLRDEFHSGALKTAYNPHCVNIFSPSKAFGKLVPWNMDAAHRWEMIGYPFARHIFRTQAKITQLLCNIIDLLLNTAIEDAPKGRDKWDALMNASFNTTNRLIAKSAFSNQAFSPAPKFDFEYVLNVLTTRHDAALNQALLVHADPVYLRHFINETKKSISYTGHDDEGKQRMLFMVPFQSMFRYEIWDRLYTIIVAIVGTLGHPRAKIFDIRSARSREYDNGLIMLEAALRVNFHQQVEELYAILSRSPAFRQHFKGKRQITDPQKAFAEDPLFWVLMELAGKNLEGGCYTASWCFSIFEDQFSTADRKERQRVDQTLHDHLIDMAAIDEVLTAILLHPSHACMRSMASAKDFCKRYGVMEQHELFNTSLESCYKVPEIREALQGFCSLKLMAKSGTLEELAENKILHEKFSKYWTLVHASVLQQVGRSKIRPAFKQAIVIKLAEFSKGQAQTFASEQNAIESAIAAKAAREATVDAGDFDTHQYATAPESTSSKAFLKELEAKAKVKTRPSPAVIEGATKQLEGFSIGETSDAKPLAAHGSVSVKTKSLEFFGLMFSSLELPQKQKDWDDLVAAMVDAGCKAVHNGGSAVTFEDKRNGKGSIVLHKPHPKTTIYPIMLKWIGHRLTKRLGWDENTFVEREKEVV